MKGFILSILTLLVSPAYSQDYRTKAREYEQRKADNIVAEQRIHQQYLNNLPNAASGRVGNNAALIEFERIFKKESNAPAVSLEENLKRRLAFTKRWRESIEKENNYEKIYGTLADTLKASGFTYSEAYKLARYGIGAATSDPNAILEVMNFKIALRDFKANYATGSYEQLLKLALTYRMAGVTCISSLRRIELRFPDKKGDIDLLVLKVMPAFYTYGDTVLDIEKHSRAQHTYITEMFLALLKKFPVETNNMADTCLVSPYERVRLTDWMKKEDLDQKAAIFLYILQAEEPATPTAANGSMEQKMKYRKLQGCLAFFRLNPKYLKDLTKSEWQRIATSKGLPIADLQMFLNSEITPASMRF